ncbi:hypothetical protein HDU76_001931, partial [Blyttiomyces sp. JEL0837]
MSTASADHDHAVSTSTDDNKTLDPKQDEFTITTDNPVPTPPQVTDLKSHENINPTPARTPITQSPEATASFLMEPSTPTGRFIPSTTIKSINTPRKRIRKRWNHIQSEQGKKPTVFGIILDMHKSLFLYGILKIITDASIACTALMLQGLIQFLVNSQKNGVDPPEAWIGFMYAVGLLLLNMFAS